MRVQELMGACVCRRPQARRGCGVCLARSAPSPPGPLDAYAQALIALYAPPYWAHGTEHRWEQLLDWANQSMQRRAGGTCACR